MDKIDIDQNLKDQLKNYGKKLYPGECCGLLTGVTHKIDNETKSIPIEWHPIDNVSNEPY